MALFKEEPPAAAPEWVVTYGDVMSLLLTFFVLLFSMSDIHKDEAEALIQALRWQFGGEKPLFNWFPGRTAALKPAVGGLASAGQLRQTQSIGGAGMAPGLKGEHPRVWSVRPGDDPAIGGVIYFAEDSPEVSEESKATLRATSELLRGKPQKIEIRGHTSARPLPPNSPHRTKWDLAYARCVNTLDYLVTLGLDAKQVRLGVAAEHEPARLSTGPLVSQESSRVEILMLNELAEDTRGSKVERTERQAP